ncbi:MAG: glycosyltransferase [Chitinophagaceae bacterium]|nr:glycosyltransferase [Chitinophagaceae bacterium]
MRKIIKNTWLKFLLPLRFKSGTSVAESVTPHPDAKPLDWNQKEAAKETYTSGREYFIFAGTIHSRHRLLVLLKAFSEFKKWQQSEMMLIIAGSTSKWTAELKDKLLTYKYRQDVQLLENPSPEVLLRLIACAYALVYLDEQDAFPVDILNALQSRIPVIADHTPSIEKAMAGRGILTAPGNHQELAAHLVRLYKDESFRTALIEKSSKRP